MTDNEIRALKNAAASSALEGLPLDDKDIAVLMDILDGKLSLEDYLNSLKRESSPHTTN